MPCLRTYVVDTSSPVLVTGATGYIAGVLVKALLNKGLTVHATVRDPSKKESVQPLLKVAETAPGKLKLFKADLLEKGCFSEGMKGCSVVFHTASPFSVSTRVDPVKDLLNPAMQGTENVLSEACKTPSVKRVVFTSSVGAIYSDAAECLKAPGGKLTEEQWNTTASLQHQPYYYSKTMAERRAWEIANDKQTQWKMVALHPSFVQGPGLTYHPTSQSHKVFKNFGDGTWASGAPNLPFAVVDVRDVVDAHVAAAFLPGEGLEGSRFIISSANSSFPHMASILHESFAPAYPVPKGAMKVPKMMIWMLAPMLDETLTRKYVSLNMNHAINLDNSKSKDALGMEYIPIEQTLQDMFKHFIDQGVFDVKKK